MRCIPPCLRSLNTNARRRWRRSGGGGKQSRQLPRRSCGRPLPPQRQTPARCAAAFLGAVFFHSLALLMNHVWNAICLVLVEPLPIRCRTCGRTTTPKPDRQSQSMVTDNVMYHSIVMQALAGVRKQEAAVKAEREGLAERLRAAETESTARVRQAVEVVEDMKVLASCMPFVLCSCMKYVILPRLNDTT